MSQGVEAERQTDAAAEGRGPLHRAGRAYREAGISGVLGRGSRFMLGRAFATTCSTWFNRELEGQRAPLHALGEAGAVNDSRRIAGRPIGDRRGATARPRADLAVEVFAHDTSRLIAWLCRHHRQFPWMAIPEELVQAEGDAHVFAGFLLDGRIVGYVKVGVGDTYVHDFRRVIRFPPGDCFIYDTFVLPEYRRRGVAFRGVVETMDELRRCGSKRIWCHIEAWNTPSLELFRRAGFEPVARVRFVRALGLSFFLRDGFIPSAGLDRLLRPGSAAA